MTRAAILRIIAGYELALGAETAVPGMKGYADYYRRSCDRPAHDLITAYIKTRNKIASEVASRMEADLEAEKAARAEVMAASEPSVPPPSDSV